MVSASDGSAFTGSVTVYVTGDAGTQAVGSVGSGACTHEGNGYHTYAPAQAETNYDLIAFTFIGTGAIPATVQVFTTYPQTGDSYARLGAPAGASVSADIASVKSDSGAILTDTGTTLPGVLGTPAGADLATDIAAVKSDTAAILTDTGTTLETHLTDIKGATFNGTTDSLEAIRNRGDAAWITATGFSTHSAADVWSVATRTLTASTNFNDVSATDVWAAATRTLTANTNLNDLDAAGVRSALGMASANLDTQIAALPTASENATATLTTQMTEAYAADGTAPTLAQAMFQTMQFLHESSVSGTTVTIKGLDGSTSKMTFTLDDATTPTSITRAT